MYVHTHMYIHMCIWERAERSEHEALSAEHEALSARQLLCQNKLGENPRSMLGLGSRAVCCIAPKIGTNLSPYICESSKFSLSNVRH